MPLKGTTSPAATVPEDRLLLCCARVNGTAETTSQIRALLAHELDWGRVHRMAGRHGVLPLLYRHLHATCLETVPRAFLDQLRDYFLRNTFRNLILTDKLLQLLQVFREHDILAIPYKGPVLTLLAYGHLGLREFCDLDLFVREEDLPKAAELLLTRGFRLAIPLPPGLEAACVREAGEVPLLHPDGTFVELHATLLRRDFHFPLDRRSLESQLRRVAFAGKDVLTFSTEHQLLFLCAHGAKHLWWSLGWICDIAELIGVQPGLNWDWLCARAKALRAERILFIGLLLSRDLLQAALPEEVVRRARADSTARTLAGQVSRRLFQDSDHAPRGVESAIFHLRVREQPRDGIRYCLAMALIPHFADWAHLSLPPLLSFLYYLVRPLRLIGKGGGQLLHLVLERSTPAADGNVPAQPGRRW
jgi:hypothetical protein